MPIALFGINNDALNLVASLILLMLVALYIALVVYTFLDARRRIADPIIVTCATVGALIPFIGTAVYTILRPPEYLEDARERELEIKAAELRVRQLAELSCPNCNFPVEKNYLRCPNCQRRLKDPCHSCGKPVDPRWALCPYCEVALPGRPTQGAPPPEARRGSRSSRGAPRQQASPGDPSEATTRASTRPPAQRPRQGVSALEGAPPADASAPTDGVTGERQGRPAEGPSGARRARRTEPADG